MTLSVCLIVKNEERVLARCLTCVKQFADEIIVVDTGSMDATKDIARTFTEHVYDFAWCEDFSAARNFALQKGSMDYLMWLDADDVVDGENIARLCELKNTLTDDVDMVFMHYDCAFDRAGRPTLHFERERLFRRDKGYMFEGRVHEAIVPRGNILYSDIHIRHEKLAAGEKGRNLRIYEGMLNNGATFSPRENYYYARELMEAGRTKEAADAFARFLEREGYLENMIDACRMLAWCLKQLGDEKGAMLALVRSFCYDIPRASVCCDMGARLMEMGEYARAAYWYHCALNTPKPAHTGGFVAPACENYIPHMQLCVCYDRMGQGARAAWHNEKAGALNGDDPAYLHNVAYFTARGIVPAMDGAQEAISPAP